jgi:hypothetical protein
MKTSWNDIRQAEDYLTGNIKEEDALVMKAKLLIDPVLRANMAAQKKVYSLIRMYGRKKLRAELDAIQEELFQDTAKHSFREKIVQLFNKTDQ